MKFVDTVRWYNPRYGISNRHSQPHAQPFWTVNVDRWRWRRGRAVGKRRGTTGSFPVLSHQTQQSGQSKTVIAVCMGEKDFGNFGRSDRGRSLDLQLLPERRTRTHTTVRKAMQHTCRMWRHCDRLSWSVVRVGASYKVK